MQWQTSSDCPEVHQEWLGRGTTGVGEVIIHQLATHPAGIFPARKRGEVFFPFAASFPFPQGKQLCKNSRQTFTFILNNLLHGSCSFHCKTSTKNLNMLHKIIM